VSEGDSAETVRALTLDDFLAFEQKHGDRRHELVGGRVYDMAGGTERHELLKGAIYTRWRAKAFAVGCRAFTGRMLRVPSGNVYYPDVFIVCMKSADALYENDAAVIVEVSSPSTRGVDRREKVAAYAQLSSIRFYAVVDPLFRHVEVAEWIDGDISWTALGSGEVLMCPYGDINIDDLYDEIDSIATT
jgi:Uma2 family endonuclease